MGGILGGLMGAAGGLNPIIPLVMKGLELATELINKKDPKDAAKVLEMLSQFVNQAGGGAAAPAAAEVQPFDNPTDNGMDAGGGAASGAGNGAGSVQVNVMVDDGARNAPPATVVSHPALPEVDGSAQGDLNLSNQASQYIEGSDGNKARTLKPGSQEWTTVMWAMQQNGNVHYDADSQRFFKKMSDGSKRDLGSLAEAETKIGANGGFDRNHPVAAGALGGHFNQQIAEAGEYPRTSNLLARFADAAAEAGMTPEDIGNQLAGMRNKLMAAEDLNRNAIDISINITEQMAIRV